MLSDVLGRLPGVEDLNAANVLALRRAIYADGSGVSPDEADALVRLNDGARRTSPEWRALFVEALTDYLVDQADPRGYVDDLKSQWLLTALTHGHGVIKGDAELELLIHILERAESAPDELAAFALRQCVAAVRAPDAGGTACVDPAEAALLRRVLYAGAGASGTSVSRAEAEALFDINDACRGGDNAPAWRELFVHGVANYLLVPPGYQGVSADEARRRQAWLESPTHFDFASLLHQSLQTTLSQTFARDDEGWRRTLAQEDQARVQAHAFTVDERSWLNARICRDGVTDPNETALLDFVLADAALPPITSAPAAPAVAHVFGKRMAGLGG